MSDTDEEDPLDDLYDSEDVDVGSDEEDLYIDPDAEDVGIEVRPVRFFNTSIYLCCYLQINSGYLSFYSNHIFDEPSDTEEEGAGVGENQVSSIQCLDASFQLM